MTWAAKRQITYFLVFMAIILIIVGIPLFSVFHKTPTCYDKKQNGNEQGVDCGGACTRLCLAAVQAPIVQWQKAFDVDQDMYSGVAYIQNPNLQAQATHVPYTFTFLDAGNNVIETRKGFVYIPPGKNFAVFESNIKVPKNSGPIHTTFEFSSVPEWIKVATPLPQLNVKNQVVSGLSSTPSVRADLENPSEMNLSKVNVTAIVYDTENTPVAVSKTFVDNLDKQSVAHIVFTWPQPFNGQVASCQQPTDVVLDIDRSGSMSSEGKNPPEPLTSVKNAARAFVEGLRGTDKAAVISFATNASSPIDQVLTKDHSAIEDAINAIEIGKGSTQYTNIYDAVQSSITEFSSSRHQDSSKKAIVLLTDGIPTHPTKAGQPNYPADKAIAAARDAQSRGIDVYSIGLGNDVNESFLKTLSGSEDRYFRAPTRNDLMSVYSQIGAAICKLGPAKVEIIPDIQPL